MKLIIYVFFLFFFSLNFKFKEINFIENLNRKIYTFNRGVDSILFSPFQNFYLNFIPSSIIFSFDNFFKNSRDCQLFFLNIFDLNFVGCKKNFIRFTFNSTFGVLGFLDFCKNLNIQYNEINFDYKFHFYLSKYINVPFIGPSTIYGFVYLIFSQIFNPWLYVSDKIFIYYFLQIINKKIEIGVDINFFHKNIFDGYFFIKDLYIQSIILNSNFIKD